LYDTKMSVAPIIADPCNEAVTLCHALRFTKP